MFITQPDLATNIHGIPAFQIIPFSNEDLQANALGILTQAQKQEYYKLWYKKHPMYQYVMFGAYPVIFAFLGLIVKLYFVLAILAFIGLFLAMKKAFQLFQNQVVKNLKITSFTGTARPYQDDTGWYIAFDDVITFEITDQPNKLFLPDQPYRVFMTDKDKVIIGARVLD